jgi:micrococcal nuclease
MRSLPPISGHVFGPGLLCAALLAAGLYQLGSQHTGKTGGEKAVDSISGAASRLDAADDVISAESTDRAATALPPVAVNSYGAAVLHVVDGDTVTVRVPIWLGQELVTKVRLKGIDAPEMRGACPSEIVRAEAARNALAALIDGQMVRLTDVTQDKYGGRVVARLMLASGVDAGAALVAAGHAKIWRGRREMGWCSLAVSGG